MMDLLLHRLLDSEENERQRLAQVLHDGPLQELHSLDFRMVALARIIEDEQQQMQLTEMRSTLRQSALPFAFDLPGLAPTGAHPFWRQRRVALLCRRVSAGAAGLGGGA